VRFFRGIAVPASKVENVISSISSSGLNRDGGKVYTWQRPVNSERLFQKCDLSRRDTQGSRESAPVGICACGEESSAAHYAWERNKVGENNTPILIEFEADPEVVAIDGNDFLYTAFQFGNSEKMSGALGGLFGPKVLRYAQTAWNSKDQDNRLALCDLAIHDKEVVTDHYKNKLIIAGRHYTKFSNAFNIKLPVGPASIIRVWTPTVFAELPVVDVNLYDLVH
jgi:hypothetical protein